MSSISGVVRKGGTEVPYPLITAYGTREGVFKNCIELAEDTGLSDICYAMAIDSEYIYAGSTGASIGTVRKYNKKDFSYTGVETTHAIKRNIRAILESGDYLYVYGWGTGAEDAWLLKFNKSDLSYTDVSVKLISYTYAMLIHDGAIYAGSWTSVVRYDLDELVEIDRGLSYGYHYAMFVYGDYLFSAGSRNIPGPTVYDVQRYNLSDLSDAGSGATQTHNIYAMGHHGGRLYLVGSNDFNRIRWYNIDTWSYIGQSSTLDGAHKYWMGISGDSLYIQLEGRIQEYTLPGVSLSGNTGRLYPGFYAPGGWDAVLDYPYIYCLARRYENLSGGYNPLFRVRLDALGSNIGGNISGAYGISNLDEGEPYLLSCSLKEGSTYYQDSIIVRPPSTTANLNLVSYVPPVGNAVNFDYYQLIHLEASQVGSLIRLTWGLEE